ncbi:MAG: MATE family efflux transporter, partial [Pseudoflavonifractor sp.]
IRQSLLGVLVCGVAALVLFQCLAGYIPKWLGAEADVYPQAVAYLRFYTLSMPLNAACILFSSILRCMGNTRMPLFFNTAANILNIILNFFLIYPTREAILFGKSVTIFGAGQGVAGAAIASAIAVSLAGLGVLICALRQGDRFAIHRGDDFRPDRGILRQAVHLGVPSAIERATVNVGQILMTALVGHALGTVALAANEIATIAEGLCYLPAYGISYAAVALVGQSVGARKGEDAQAYGSLAAKASFVLCIVTGALLFAFAQPLASLFNTDPAVVNLSARVLRIVSISEPLFAVSIVLTGALRGAQDVRFPMVMSLACMWGIRILLAPILIFGFHMGLEAIWIAMAADLIVRGLICTQRWRGGKWRGMCGLGGAIKN